MDFIYRRNEAVYPQRKQAKANFAESASENASGPHIHELQWVVIEDLILKIMQSCVGHVFENPTRPGNQSSMFLT